MKFLKGKKKVRFVAMTLALATIVSLVVKENVFKSKAEESMDSVVVVQESNVPNLRENYDEDNMLCKKLEYDLENNVTQLPEHIEKELNEVGVFDSEINDFAEDELERLENAETINIGISYSAVDDESGEKIDMTEDEIDLLIQESIEEGNMDYSEEEQFDILAFVGIKPVVAYAANPSLSKSGAMKQLVCATQSKKGGKIHVTYTAEWLKEAKYRGKDVCGVVISNASILPDSWKCEHTAQHKVVKKNLGNQTTIKPKKTNPTTYNINAGTGMSFTVDLFGDRDKMDANLALRRIQESYLNEKIKVEFDCQVDNKNIKTVSLTSNYWHLQSSKSIEPSVSIDSKGISVSISGSKKNYYEQITNNAYLLYTYK